MTTTLLTRFRLQCIRSASDGRNDQTAATIIRHATEADEADDDHFNDAGARGGASMMMLTPPQASPFHSFIIRMDLPALVLTSSPCWSTRARTRRHRCTMFWSRSTATFISMLKLMTPLRYQHQRHRVISEFCNNSSARTVIPLNTSEGFCKSCFQVHNGARLPVSLLFWKDFIIIGLLRSTLPFLLHLANVITDVVAFAVILFVHWVHRGRTVEVETTLLH